MTFDEWYQENEDDMDAEIWEALENVGMNIQAKNIRDLLERAYEQGKEAGVWQEMQSNDVSELG